MRGPRVHLRPLSSEDTDFVLRWRADPEIANQLFSDRPPTREEHEQFLERLRTSNDRVEFAIVLNDGDFPVGTIGLSRIDRANGEAEYGILIGEQAAKGKGIAREASEIILEHAFLSLRLRRVKLQVFADNTRAIGLYGRLGFRSDGESPSTKMKNGSERQVLTMVVEAGF